MRIFLARSGTDKRVPVEIEPGDTIQEVKQKAKASDPKLRFTFEGKVIEYGSAMSEYGIGEDSVLMMATLVCLQVERREEFYVDLTSTVRRAKGLIRERLGLDLQADLHVFLGQQQLSDDDLSLQEAGVAAGKTLRPLSGTLAEESARLSKVYKIGLGEILKDGKAPAPGSQQQFPLDCPLSELAELGPGWPLFFDFGFFLASLCLALFVLHFPLVVMFASASDMDRWSAAVREHLPMVGTSLASAGNLGPHGSNSALPGCCTQVCCVVLFLAVLYYTHRQNVLKRELDDLEVEPMDYALLIHGMPGEAPEFWADEAQVRDFVEGCLGEDSRVEVVQVVLGFDIPRLQALLKDLQHLTQAEQDPDGTTPLLSCAYTKEEVTNILTTPDLLRKELGCHATCVVTLRWPEDHRKVLQRWDTVWEQVLWALRGMGSVSKTWGLQEEAPTLGEYSSLKQIDGRHPVRICRAGAPSDLLWENFGASFADCFSARLKTNALMGAIFLVGFAVIWVVETIAGGRIGGAGWQVLLRCLALVLVNMAAASLAKRFSRSELHLTRTDQDDSLMVKLAIYMSFNYTFLLIALYRDSGTSWYCVGGLLSTILVLMPCDTAIIFLTVYFGIAPHMSLLAKKLTAPDPLTTAGFTQAQYNKLYQPEEMPISRPLAHLIKSFLMFMFFLPFWPLGSLFMVLSLVLKTLAYKKQLLRISKRPYRQSHIIAFSALKFVYVGVMVYAFSSWWFLEPSLTGTGNGSHRLNWLFVLAAAYLLCAPRWINDALGALVHRLVRPAVGCCMGSGDGTDPDSHDYYVVQQHWAKSQKYHTASQAYEQLTRAMLAKKVPPPWDPVTGDLRVPLAPAASGGEAP